MFEYTIVEARQQLLSLPLGIVLWVRWLGLANLSGLVFWRRPQARWVLAAMVFIILTNGPMLLTLGLVKALSIPHLFVWMPLTAYLAMELRSGRVEHRTPFGIWCFIVMLTNLISVVFDLRDGAEYLLGDRAIVATDPMAELPIITLLVIGVCMTALLAYSLGLPQAAAAARQEDA